LAGHARRAAILSGHNKFVGPDPEGPEAQTYHPPLPCIHGSSRVSVQEEEEGSPYPFHQQHCRGTRVTSILGTCTRHPRVENVYHSAANMAASIKSHWLLCAAW
jgi:hypothetical protein